MMIINIILIIFHVFMMKMSYFTKRKTYLEELRIMNVVGVRK